VLPFFLPLLLSDQEMLMNEPLTPIILAVVALLIGAAISWVVASARARSASAAATTSALQASTALQIELSSARAKASRVPELERELAATIQTLNGANERKAALESEVLRLPELESRHGQAADALAQAAGAAVELRESNSRLSAELAAEQENLSALRSRFEETQTRLETQQRQANSLAVQVAQLEKSLESERNVSQEKLALLLDAKTALADQFKALANEILEEKSKRFTEQNQSNLGALLDPLKLKITEFQTKIEDNYVKEGRDRTA
jgi:DNA recombination protein RmuC